MISEIIKNEKIYSPKPDLPYSDNGVGEWLPDPLDEDAAYRKIKRRDMYEDEELGMWYCDGIN